MSGTMAGVTTLGVREAAEKYGIPDSTLRGWVADGLVRVIAPGGRGRGHKSRIVEADVKALAEAYRPGRSRTARRPLADALNR